MLHSITLASYFTSSSILSYKIYNPKPIIKPTNTVVKNIIKYFLYVLLFLEDKFIIFSSSFS